MCSSIFFTSDLWSNQLSTRIEECILCNLIILGTTREMDPWQWMEIKEGLQTIFQTHSLGQMHTGITFTHTSSRYYYCGCFCMWWLSINYCRRFLDHVTSVTGDVHRHDTGDDDNFSQVSLFWRNVLNDEEKEALTANIANHLCKAQKFIQVTQY